MPTTPRSQLRKSDSQWSINALTGKWRPKTHHNLMNYIRGLVRQPSLKVHFQWVKAHRGTEGNEKADQLAKQGRALAAAQGGRDYTAPPIEENQENQALCSTRSFTAQRFHANYQGPPIYEAHPLNKRSHTHRRLTEARKPRKTTTPKHFETRPKEWRAKTVFTAYINNFRGTHQVSTAQSENHEKPKERLRGKELAPGC